MTWGGEHTKLCIVELCTWNIHNFINQYHPNTFNKEEKRKKIRRATSGEYNSEFSLLHLIACIGNGPKLQLFWGMKKIPNIELAKSEQIKNEACLKFNPTFQGSYKKIHCLIIVLTCLMSDFKVLVIYGYIKKRMLYKWNPAKCNLLRSAFHSS